MSMVLIAKNVYFETTFLILDLVPHAYEVGTKALHLHMHFICYVVVLRELCWVDVV